MDDYQGAKMDAPWFLISPFHIYVSKGE